MMPLSPFFEWLRPWAERGRIDRLAAGYRGAFANRKEVLADLARLCHADTETYVPGDALATAFNEGRRAVWLHIGRMLSLSPRDIADLKEVLTHDRPADH